jgi:hypothetical protein
MSQGVTSVLMHKPHTAIFISIDQNRENLLSRFYLSLERCQTEALMLAVFIPYYHYLGILVQRLPTMHGNHRHIPEAAKQQWVTMSTCGMTSKAIVQVTGRVFEPLKDLQLS